MSEKGNLIFFKYRHLIFAIIIIIIVIILDIILENYTKKIVKDINTKLELIENKLEESNIDTVKVVNISDELIDYINKKEKIINCYIEHEDVELISVKLNVLNTQIKIKNYKEAKSTATEIKGLVKFLNNKHELNLRNLF